MSSRLPLVLMLRLLAACVRNMCVLLSLHVSSQDQREKVGVEPPEVTASVSRMHFCCAVDLQTQLCLQDTESNEAVRHWEQCNANS